MTEMSGMPLKISIKSSKKTNYEPSSTHLSPVSTVALEVEKVKMVLKEQSCIESDGPGTVQVRKMWAGSVSPDGMIGSSQNELNCLRHMHNIMFVP